MHAPSLRPVRHTAAVRVHRDIQALLELATLGNPDEGRLDPVLEDPADVVPDAEAGLAVAREQTWSAVAQLCSKLVKLQQQRQASTVSGQLNPTISLQVSAARCMSGLSGQPAAGQVKLNTSSGAIGLAAAPSWLGKNIPQRNAVLATKHPNSFLSENQLILM